MFPSCTQPLPTLSRRGALRLATLGAVAPLIVAGAVPASAARRRTAYKVPRHIDATGTSDVSAAINQWLTTLPDWSVADFGRGVYRCESALRLTDRTGIRIQGGTFRRTNPSAVVWPVPSPHWWALRCTDTVFRDVHVQGTNTVADQREGFGSYKVEYEFEAAFRIEQYTRVRIRECSVNDVWGDGVQLQVGTGAHVHDTVIDRNGRQGVTIIGRDTICERVRVEHSRRSGFDLEPDTSAQAVSAIEIRDCYTNTIGLPIASAGRGAVNDVYVHHNSFAGPSVPVVYCKASDGSARRNWRVTDNVSGSVLGSPQAGYLFVNASNVEISRNITQIAETQSRLSVRLSGCGGPIVVTGNAFGDGNWIENGTASSDQVLTVSGNSPTQRIATI